MIESVNVIGARGSVGSAMSARLAERGLSLREGEAELVLLCVPDRAIAEVASAIEPGPWLAHRSLIGNAYRWGNETGQQAVF